MPRSTFTHAIRFVSMFVLFTHLVVAQTASRDIVYLRNGSVIKGIIIEQIPNKTIKIQTSDGSIFVYDLSEVERIQKEEPPVTSTPAPPAPFLTKTSFFLGGGIAVPIGEFASTTSNSGGAAKAGFSLAGDLRIPLGGQAFALLAGTFSSNPLDVDALRDALGSPSDLSISAGNWLSIAPFAGLGIIIPVSEGTGFLLSGKLGVLFGTSPEIRLSSGGASATQGSASASAVAYGFSAGIMTSQKFSICVQLQSGQPKYSVTASGSGGSLSSELEQSMSILQIIVGLQL